MVIWFAGLRILLAMNNIQNVIDSLREGTENIRFRQPVSMESERGGFALRSYSAEGDVEPVSMPMYSSSDTPTFSRKRSAREGIEPLGSSLAIRSTRCIG